MKREVVEPTVQDDGRGGLKVEHPAYAQIGAGRVSGGAYLYGSDFQHRNFVRITIRASHLGRSLSNDWPYGGREYIEVDLSEAQWAEFVSSMNVGFGVQCTLRHRDGELVPELPAPVRRVDQFQDEIKQKVVKALEHMDDLVAQIDTMKVSEKQKGELKSKVSLARQQIVSNMPFVLEQFSEHMESTVQKAKTEINAYGTHLLMKTGLAQLARAEGQQEVLGFDAHGTEDEQK